MGLSLTLPLTLSSSGTASSWLGSTHAANRHEVRLVQLCFDFYMIEAKPENLVGDRAYDSDALDEDLRSQGIEMIAPHRSNRVKLLTQDRRSSADMLGAGWLNVSSRGSSGAVACCPMGVLSSASSSSLAYSSSSGNSEIGSRHIRRSGQRDGRRRWPGIFCGRREARIHPRQKGRKWTGRNTGSRSYMRENWT
jgi:hypothetical protein